MKLTLDNIIIKDNKIYDQNGEFRGEIIYRYIRGSQLYGTNVETSDVDEGGVYVMPDDALTGLGYDYQEEIKDEKNDKAMWEIGRYMELLLKSNPNVLESLFVPDDKVIYENPVMKKIRDNRDMFVTKKCFNPFGGYAVSQIRKAQGQDKKIHWDIEQMTRKTPLDFIYTFSKQGSTNIQDWLAERGLDQRNIGLVNIPNMPGVYGAYYDFGQHIRLEGITKEYFCDYTNYVDKFIKYCYNTLIDEWDRDNMTYNYNIERIWREHSTPIGGYCGIISPNMDSNELRFTSYVNFSSVKKGEEPICWIAYNKDGYQSHCTKYKEYEEWKQHRNKARYESNLEGEMSGNPDMKYDCKNMMHCFRLMAMAKEIAEGKGFNVDRTNIDREFLLDVRNRKYGYSELSKKMLKLKEEMDDAISKSTIREDADVELLNKILLDIRKEMKIV